MNENLPNQRPYPPDLRAAYEEAIRNFTLDDLRKYEIEEEGFPLEDAIAEMEEIQRRYEEKRKQQ
jgi:hypothetical protein